MLTALTLVVLISASDGAQELALHDAAQTALGGDAIVSVRVSAPLPNEETALQLLHSLRADAIATVDWLDSAQRKARVVVYRDAQEQRRLERTVEFADSDSAPEQGRTLGFLIAAMLPEVQDTSVLPPTQPKLEQSIAAPARTQVSPTPTQVLATASVPAAAAPRAVEVHRTASLDAVLSGRYAFGPTGSGLGGALGGQLDLGARFGLRLDVCARAGRITVLDASSVAFDVAPGVSWRTPSRFSSQPLTVEVRFAPLARYMSVSRDRGASEMHARWLPGARLSLGGLWWFSQELALLASAGLDATFGKTELLRMGMEVSSIGPFGLSIALGVRAQL